jgi:sulfur carrier protein
MASKEAGQGLMKIKVNGQVVEIEAGLNIEDLLTALKVEMPLYVTVQLNEELLERENFASTIPQAGDSIEFLYFMGGGRR